MKEIRKALFCPVHQMSFEDIKTYYSELVGFTVIGVVPFYKVISDSCPVFYDYNIEMAFERGYLFAGDLTMNVQYASEGVAGTYNAFAVNGGVNRGTLTTVKSYFKTQIPAGSPAFRLDQHSAKHRVVLNYLQYRFNSAGDVFDFDISLILNGVLLRFDQVFDAGVPPFGFGGVIGS